MPTLTTGAVMTGAITDLINAAILLPMVLSLRKRMDRSAPQSRLWLTLMTTIGLSSLLGFLLHGFQWGRTGWVGIWLVLYIALFTALEVFLALALHTRTGGQRPYPGEMGLLRVGEGLVLVLLTVLLLLGRNPIRIFLWAGLAMGLPAFYVYGRLALEGHRGARILFLALLPQIPGMVLQLMRKGEFTLLFTFDFNSIYHLCLTASIIILYLAARKWAPAKAPA